MEVLNLISFAFTLVPVFVGAGIVLFNRRFSLEVLRYQKALLNVEYGETYLMVVRVGAIVTGAIFVVVGLVVAAQTLFL